MLPGPGRCPRGAQICPGFTTCLVVSTQNVPTSRIFTRGSGRSLKPRACNPKLDLSIAFPKSNRKNITNHTVIQKKWVSIVFNQKRKFITWSWDVSIVFPWKNHQNLPISGVARAFSPRWPDDHGGSRLSWEARNGKCCRGNWMTYGDFMGFPSSPWKSQSLSSSCCDLPTAKRLLNCDWKLVPTQAEAAPGKENWSSQTTLSDRIGSHFWWD